MPHLFAIKAFLSKAWPFLLAATVLIAVVMIYREGKDAGTGEADRARLEGNVKSLEDKSAADTNAAATRVTDATRAVVEREELKEAVANAPDPASARRAYYACVSLQQRARADNRPAPECR